MKQLTRLIFGAILLVSPFGLMAQHHGGRGGNASGSRGPSGISDKDDLKDFKRAIALQATPDQMQQFRQLSLAVEAAEKQTHDVLQFASNSSAADSSQLSRYADPLTDAVDDAESANEKFLKSFSAAQKSGLKNTTKKLEKTSSEIAKQSKALSENLGRAKADNKQIASTAEKLEKSINELREEHLAVGNEMGIQDETATTDPPATHLLP